VLNKGSSAEIKTFFARESNLLTTRAEKINIIND